MQRQIGIVLLFLTICFFSNAQLIIKDDTPMPQMYFSFGYGFGGFPQSVDDYELSAKDFVGPFYFAYYYNFDATLNGGVTVSYSYNRFKSYNNIDYYYNPSNQDIKTMGVFKSVQFAARMNYIGGFKGNIQFYAGFGLSLIAAKAKYNYAEAIYSNGYNTGYYNIVEKRWNKTRIIPELKVGFNLIVRKGLGFYSEVGVGEVALQLGLVKCIGKNLH